MALSPAARTAQGTKQYGEFLNLTGVFDAAKLAAMYPTHDAYVDAFRASADEAVAAGFLLEEDAAAMVRKAETSSVGS